LEFITRGRKTSRGGSPSRIVFDEALFLTDEQQQSIVPALSAQSMNAEGPPQFIFTSSAPLPESTVLHRVRERGTSPDAGKLFFAEWSCEEGANIRDRDRWWSCNPGMGIRISEEWVAENELPPSMSDEAFKIERLGIVQAADGGSSVLPAAKWEACRDSRSQVVGPVSLALSVSPGSTSASFAVAGARADGLWHVEIPGRDGELDHRPGTGWVVAIAKRASDALGVPVRVDPKSQTAALLPALKAAGVDVVEVSTVEYVAACVAFQDAVLNADVRHIDQSPLNAAVAGADVRVVGESWAWSERASSIDICPLNAVTLALAGARVPVKKFFVY
jgi:hypothetical protein